MDNIESIDGQVKDQTSNDRLAKWAEIGFSSEAVAVYGTSQAFLNRSLDRGFIPAQMTQATPDFESYLAALGKYGKNIYFSYPLIDNLSSKDPELMKKILANYPGFNDAWIRNELAVDKIRMSSMLYAQMNAFMHHFSQETGMRFDNQSTSDDPIIELAYELIPDEMKVRCEEMMEKGYGIAYAPGSLNSGREELREEVKRRIDRERLKEILRETINQRGVLLYYASGILNRAVPGWEAENELLVVTDEPLGLENISGIEYT